MSVSSQHCGHPNIQHLTPVATYWTLDFSGKLRLGNELTNKVVLQNQFFSSNFCSVQTNVRPINKLCITNIPISYKYLECLSKLCHKTDFRGKQNKETNAKFQAG